MKSVVHLMSLLAMMTVTANAAAQSVCASDSLPPPVQLLERFTNADCAACWSDPATARAPAGTVVLDWVVSGSKGDDAPLSAVASRDAADRLAAVGEPSPARAAVTTQRIQPEPALRKSTLRVARGLALSGYIGASIELKPATLPAAGQPLTAWLALVEVLPMGLEGSPVARQLVRGLFQSTWASHAPGLKSAPTRLFEQRSMSVGEGVNPDRLQVVGWVTDRHGHVLRAAQSQCTETR